MRALEKLLIGLGAEAIVGATTAGALVAVIAYGWSATDSHQAGVCQP